MKRGCAYGLGCLVVFILSPIWVPMLFAAVLWSLGLAMAILERI